VKTQSVFEKYAHEYDILTNAKAREKTHREEVRALIDRFHPGRVLDAGCAVGLTASLFAEQGVEAVGLDCSRSMIAEARTKYAGTGLPLSFRTGRFERLPHSLDGRFDLVVCLANSISGVGTAANLKLGFAGFYRMLRQGGALVLQSLNLSSLKDGEVLPVKATQEGRIGYLRFARRRNNLYELTVVRVDMSASPLQFEVFSHEFDSFSVDQMEATLRRSGFRRIRRYGDLSMSKPFRTKSRDIVLVSFAS